MYKVRINRIKDDYRDINKIKDIISTSLLNIGKPLSENKLYLVKPNLLKPSPPESAVVTHPTIIKAVIELIKDSGAKAIIGDSPAIGSIEKVLNRLELIDFLKHTNTKTADFSKRRIIKNHNNLIYKELLLPDVIFEVDEIINIPKLKTHQMMVFTLAVKNLFGFIFGKEKIKYHFLADKSYTHFAKLLLDIYRTTNPQINILDGIIGMEGNGPASGNKKNFGILAVSNNALTLDYVLIKTLNLDIKKIPHLSVALEEHFLEVRDSFIEVDIDNPLMLEKILLPKAHKLSFTVPDAVSNLIKKFVISSPSVDKKRCISCRICLENCPIKAMDLKEHISIDLKKCIRCYCCQEMCDKKAIKVRRTLINVW